MRQADVESRRIELYNKLMNVTVRSRICNINQRILYVILENLIDTIYKQSPTSLLFRKFILVNYGNKLKFERRLSLN